MHADFLQNHLLFSLRYRYSSYKNTSLEYYKLCHIPFLFFKGCGFIIRESRRRLVDIPISRQDNWREFVDIIKCICSVITWVRAIFVVTMIGRSNITLAMRVCTYEKHFIKFLMVYIYTGFVQCCQFEMC